MKQYILLALVDLKILFLGRDLVICIKGSPGVKTVVAPARDDIGWAGDSLQCRNLTSPVLIKVHMAGIVIHRVLDVPSSPVEEHWISTRSVSFVGSLRRNQLSYSSLN